MQYKLNFIKKLKEYRKQKNLTQDDLAQILGFSQKNIAKWEQGLTVPSIEVLIDLSERMGISLDELMGRKKSVYEECAEYIVSVENLEKEEYGMIYDIVCSIGDNFVFSTLDHSLPFEDCVKISQGEIKKIAIERLIEKGHIILQKDKWEVSKDFAIEGFLRNEKLYNESVIQLSKDVERMEGLSKSKKLTVVEKEKLERSKKLLKSDKEFLEEIIAAKKRYLSEM